jgi:hypothetical protein
MKKRHSIRPRGNGLLARELCRLLLLLLPIARISAQQFTLDTASFAATAQSSGGDFSLASSIGQPDVAVKTAAGNFSFLPGFWSATVSSPLLSVLRDGANIVLLWPESAGPDFVIEEAEAFANPSTNTTWFGLSIKGELTGGVYRASIPVGSGNQFFRLHKP